MSAISLRRNVIANYVGQLVGVALAILTVPVYIRLLGAEAYGLVGFFATLQVWLQMLDLGFSQSIAREVARLGEGGENAAELRRLFRSAKRWFGLLAAVAGVAVYLLAPWISDRWLRTEHLGDAELREAVRLMAGMIALRFLVAPHRCLLLGLERQVSYNLFNVVVAVARFAGVLAVFRWTEPGIQVFFRYQLAVTLIEAGGLAILARRALPAVPAGQTVREGGMFSRQTVNFASTVAFTSVIWTMVTYVDRLILSKLLPLSEFAYYSAGVSMASAVSILATPASNALLPRLTRLMSVGRDEAALSLYRQFTVWVVLVAVPAAATLACYPRLALWMWTGNAALADYAAVPLGIYVAGNAIVCVASFPYFLQYARGNLTWHLYGNVVFALVFLPLLAFAAATYGATGAAIIWTGSNFLYLVGWSPLVHRRLAPGLHARWLGRDIGLISLAIVFVVGLLAFVFPPAASRWGGFVQLAAVTGTGTLAGLAAWWLRPAETGSLLQVDLSTLVLRVWQRWMIRFPLLERVLRWRQASYLRGLLHGRRRIIVFLVPGADTVNGGILAMVGHAAESARLESTHQAAVCVCALPGQVQILRYTQFRNEAVIVTLPQILEMAEPGAHLHLNVPEVHVPDFIRDTLPLLERAAHCSRSFNVMLQNIDYAPEPALVARLAASGPVTVTTAHKAYANEETSRRLNCSVSHWSVYVSSDQYRRRPFAEKEKLMVISPDAHPRREEILDRLKRALPDYRFLVIQGMTYEEYKLVIGKARFSLTFGEGLDAYFVEPIFSGAVGLAVYNERFFTAPYRSLPGVYEDWDRLAEAVPALVERLGAETFAEIQAVQFAVASANYCHAEYRENLRQYYASMVAVWNREPALALKR